MVKNLQLENIETQSEDDHVYIGNFTQTYLTKVIDDGSISSQQCKWFINNTSIIQYNTQHNTSSQSLVSLQGTLSAIMIVKTLIDDSLVRKPPNDLLAKVKKATKEYNAEYSTASK